MINTGKKKSAVESKPEWERVKVKRQILLEINLINYLIHYSSIQLIRIQLIWTNIRIYLYLLSCSFSSLLSISIAVEFLKWLMI